MLALLTAAPALARYASPGGDSAQSELPQVTTESKAMPSDPLGHQAASNEPLKPRHYSKTEKAYLQRLSSIRPIEKIGPISEEKINKDRYRLDAKTEALFKRFVMPNYDSPEPLSEKSLAALTRAPALEEPVRDVKYTVEQPKGVFSRESIDKVSVALTQGKTMHIKAFVPLTRDEYFFLSGILVYQGGDNCAPALGLFAEAVKTRPNSSQSNYYLAACAKKVGLESEFYSRVIKALQGNNKKYLSRTLALLPDDLPEDMVLPIGTELTKAAADVETIKDKKVFGNAKYWLAQYGVRSGHRKLTLAHAPAVPENHKKYIDAQFVLAIAQNENGDSPQAIATLDSLLKKAEANELDKEMTATVALNLARMQFEAQHFKPSLLNFLKVYKDHPLWLQSLTEMGWAQLRSGDYEGAIGNMYSIHSPYFRSVYKPESYVIRTIGYLDICQYGDAYRTLTKLEKEYRPWLEKMDSFAAQKLSAMDSVRAFLTQNAKGTGATAEFNGLPGPVVRELARHRDFISQQKLMNERIDEKSKQQELQKIVNQSVVAINAKMAVNRTRMNEMRRRIIGIQTDKSQEVHRSEWRNEYNREYDLYEANAFALQLMLTAKVSIASYSKLAKESVERRTAQLRIDMDKGLNSRLTRMREDLKQILANNELLRYEVFAGAGENLRFQIAGGEKGKRVPASVLPQSKSLQWDFDGEYWEDEVGHYRSSLRNNCPDSVRGSANINPAEGGQG